MLYIIIGVILAGYAKQNGKLENLTNVGVIVNYLAVIFVWPIFAIAWLTRKMI